MKIITVVGARPQFIKAAVVSREIKKHTSLEEVLVHTGQHYDPEMSQIFFRELELPVPAFHLGVNNLSPAAMTGRMMERIEEVLLKEKPGLVLVYGDTYSTLAGALAARKQKIRLAHVESGMRSYTMDMPEEVNRVITDRISDILFCSTERAVQNLKKEGFDHLPGEILLSGDVMYDAALYYAEKAAQYPMPADLRDTRNSILCTVHRAENTDDTKKLRSIIHALNQVNETVPVVWPIHPRTKKIIQSEHIPLSFTILEPVGYLEMINLIKKCRLVVTDSGGLQKEAFFHQRLCVTLRDETEWTELVDAQYNLLAGHETERIVTAVEYTLKRKPVFDKKFYGDGYAAEKIVKKILEFQA